MAPPQRLSVNCFDVRAVNLIVCCNVTVTSKATKCCMDTLKMYIFVSLVIDQGALRIDRKRRPVLGSFESRNHSNDPVNSL